MERKRTSTAVITNGFIAVIVGVLMMVWPGATAEVVVRIFAGWLAVIAIASIVLAPRGTRSGGLFIRAILLILFATLVFFTPMLFASLVTVLAGMGIIFFSVIGIVMSLFIRGLGVGAWWVLGLISVIGVVIGGFFLFAPQAGVTTLVFTLSVFIAVVGAALIALGTRLRRLESQIRADPHHNRPDDGGGDVISGGIIE